MLAIFVLAFTSIFSIYNGIQCEEITTNNYVGEGPIIGILAQEQSYYLEGKFPLQYKSYIAASYVKSVESAGAKVVPIWIGQEREYYEDILSKINGVLFPGGATYFNTSDGYADAGEHIFEIVKNLNDKGIYFPLFGICLGFELLAVLDAARVDLRADCYAKEISFPLHFTTDYRNSRIFAKAPDDILYILATQNVTLNSHQYCLTKELLEEHNLQNNWKVLTTNKDLRGLEFISTFEHSRYPIYGIQFHPEKNLFEWVPNHGIVHTQDAVKGNRYFMDFFVSEARRNKNKFSSRKEEMEYLIYNYQTTYTGKIGSSYEQCYMFS